MAKHVIVISQDAMVYEDTQTLRTLSNFGGIWPQTARVDRVRSVYPTITYPAHVSMMTGVYPDKHGVVNNEQPRLFELNSPWVHFRSTVKAPTVFDYAKAAGLSTAAVFWPVTGGDASIDYLIDEYWPQSPAETMRQCFANSGSSKQVLEKVIDPNLHLQVNRTHPYCDDFVFGCACSMIREFAPNLLMIHPANIDAYRHETGLFSPKVTQGLYEIDHWFGNIVKATRDAGIYDDTDFFIVSDHGQLNIVRTVALNAVLAAAGLVQVDENGNVTDYIAAAKSAGLSAQIYLKNPQNEAALQKTEETLRRLCAQGLYGFSRVYTAQQALTQERLAGNFSFVLETDGYTSFSNDWREPLVRVPDNSNYRLGRATHGHQPDKGPQPTLFAAGPHIRPGAVLQNASIVDEPVTVARVLGLQMPETDGRVLYELLRDL